MEVNKEQAEKCRDLGAAALRNGDFEKSVRMLEKSLKLYALPGAEDLLSHAKSKLADSKVSDRSSNTDYQSTSNGSEGNSNDSNRGSNTFRRQSSAPSTSSSSSMPRPNVAERRQSGLDGRAYTQEQVQIIKHILASKAKGRGAHYKVLGLPNDKATENEIKKAYRKISLKVHPDKNSAPGADEAFKAVGLAYATLSDPQKRTIYDRYGDEDPDNVGGGMGGGMRRRAAGQEMSPEDIFNAFFGNVAGHGGGMGPGFHVYSTGFGPGMHFAGGQPRNRQPQQQRGQRAQQEDNTLNFNSLMQLLPLILIILVSFFNSSSIDPAQKAMPGENQYFSLTNKPQFNNRLVTKLTSVKDIPYFVSDKFLRTYHRDRYQLSQVERMVENAYEQYLYRECQNQLQHRKTLYRKAKILKDYREKEKTRKLADEYVASRCDELDDLFPNRRKKATA